MIGFKKVLIANRGEIAVRIIHTLHRLGIGAAVVYGPADADTPAVQAADESYPLASNDRSSSYLDLDQIIRIALNARCDALHPGYGFLAENPLLPAACANAGITFIGPTQEQITLMGNKTAARHMAQSLGIPVIPGATGSVEELLNLVGTFSFPLLVKPSAGGGGKGMRRVNSSDDLEEALWSAAREAESYFSDGRVYIEQLIEKPRHIEVQVLGDTHDNLVHLFERECTIQRRHQKVVEEAPSPTLDQQQREQLCNAALKLARSIHYVSAGTIEFLVDGKGDFYFLEMNTRIQVEHGVTEMITGIDLVEQQLRIAAGLPLSLWQEEMAMNGHAIECRLYAESPELNFRPSAGALQLFETPKGEGFRIDSGIGSHGVIDPAFDPLFAKLIAHGKDREEAIERMQQLLHNTIALGIPTNRIFLEKLLLHPHFTSNRLWVTFAEEHREQILDLHITTDDAAQRQQALLAFLTLSILPPDPRHDRQGSPWAQGHWRHWMQIPYLFEGEAGAAILLKSNAPTFEWQLDRQTHRVLIRQLEDHRAAFVMDDRPFHLHFVRLADDTMVLNLAGSDWKGRRTDLLPPAPDWPPPVRVANEKEARVSTPLPGRVARILVKEGDVVNKGAVLLVVESMKMENVILAGHDGVVAGVLVREGQNVQAAAHLITLHFEEHINAQT